MTITNDNSDSHRTVVLCPVDFYCHSYEQDSNAVLVSISFRLAIDEWRYPTRFARCLVSLSMMTKMRSNVDDDDEDHGREE